MIDSLKSLFGSSKGYYKRMQGKRKAFHSSWGFRIVIFILFNLATILNASPVPVSLSDGELSTLRKLQRIESVLADGIGSDPVSLMLEQEPALQSTNTNNNNIAKLSESSSEFPFAASSSNDNIKSIFTHHHATHSNINTNNTNVQYPSQAQPILSSDDDGSAYLNSFHKFKPQRQQKPKTVVVNNGSGKRKIFRVDKAMQRVEKKSWKIPIKSVGLYSENSKDSHAPQKFMDELTQIFDSFKDS